MFAMKQKQKTMSVIMMKARHPRTIPTIAPVDIDESLTEGAVATAVGASVAVAVLTFAVLKGKKIILKIFKNTN